MNTFLRKGYGRIYALTPQDVERVKSIIKEMDEYEYTYLPNDLITTHDEYPNVVYVHKFCDMDLDKLTARCWAEGCLIWCFDAQHVRFPSI